MHDFGFFLKTYGKDYDRAVRLIESFENYNVEALPLYLACPQSDIKQFTKLERRNIKIIPEEEICTNVFLEDAKWTAGYLNQEIYKLAFWEMGLCANYMCIDSDAIFIRPFYLKDFMYDEKTPYTSLEEDNDLCSDCYYNKLYWNGRLEWIKKIEDEIDFHPYHLLSCHGFQIFSGKVLKSLKSDFMGPKRYTYKKLIEIAPYEFSWYNLWLQKTEIIPIHPIGYLFKTFHLKQHHIFYVLHGMRVEDWAKGYIGIIVNSNYGVGEGDYYDLSIYNGNNTGLPDDVIRMNYKFYKRLMKDRNYRLPLKYIGKIKNRIQGAIINVRKGK